MSTIASRLLIEQHAVVQRLATVADQRLPPIVGQLQLGEVSCGDHRFDALPRGRRSPPVRSCAARPGRGTPWRSAPCPPRATRRSRRRATVHLLQEHGLLQPERGVLAGHVEREGGRLESEHVCEPLPQQCAGSARWRHRDDMYLLGARRLPREGSRLAGAPAPGDTAHLVAPAAAMNGQLDQDRRLRSSRLVVIRLCR